jgi:hypothetical protein
MSHGFQHVEMVMNRKPNIMENSTFISQATFWGKNIKDPQLPRYCRHISSTRWYKSESLGIPLKAFCSLHDAKVDFSNFPFSLDFKK